LQMAGDRRGQLTGVRADLLGDLERERGRVVAVLRIARSLDRGGRRQSGLIEVALGQHGAGGVQYRGGKVGGSHRVMLSRVDCGTWRRPNVLVTMRDEAAPR